MTTLCLVTGASLFGWLLPEFVLILSPKAENFRRVPLVFNFMCTAGAALIAFGVAA